MHNMKPQGGPSDGRDIGPGHELTDVTVGGIVKFGIALLVLTILILIGLGVVMGGFKRVEVKNEAARPALYKDAVGQFPEPRSQESPRIELSAFRADERKQTETYGWADQKAGIARIPVDRAVDLLAERGLPKGKATPPRGSRTRDQP